MTEPQLQDFVSLSALLADPSAWTQRADARDAHGHSTAFDDPHATSWCLYGAMHRCVPRDSWQPVGDALRTAAGPVALSQFNDQATHAEVLALIERAKGDGDETA